MSIPEFADMVACHAAALMGASELFDDAQVRTFGLVESGETKWGWLHVYRLFNGPSKAPSYFLVVKDPDRKEVNRFELDKHVVADAIASDLSVIANALRNHPAAAVWIAENFESEFHAKVERIRTSMAAISTAAEGNGAIRV